MDRTGQYMMMCEKATEIQKVWKPADGDYYITAEWKWRKTDDNTQKKQLRRWYPYDDGSDIKIHGTFCQKAFEYNHIVYFWMPRQDQLQVMLMLRGEPAYRLLNRFHQFMLDNFYTMDSSKIEPVADKSMEQLWFLFVMKENYKKSWTGEEWVSEDTDRDRR